jgi:hypothetical protein
VGRKSKPTSESTSIRHEVGGKLGVEEKADRPAFLRMGCGA